MDTKYKVFWYSIAFYLLFGFTYLFKAQQYPIRLIPVMLPPYSLKLGEYATSTDNKLQLQVLMTDLQQPSHQVAIKFFLEGGTTNTPIASSAPFIQGYNPFTLLPGQQITLSNVDLRSLFALDNLSGIDPLTYSKALPDGVYSFCFQAYDWFTKNNLSQKACAIAFFNQYEPPFLTLPQNGEKIPALSPYDNGAAAMIFQWQPRQIAPNTRYIFTLKELWDLERDPISGFLVAPPFWQEDVFSPTLFYGLDKAQLIPGKRYAWQVQAKSGNPVYGANPTEDNGTYKNNGLSEIFYFDYIENCKTPSLLTAQNAGRGKVKIQWMLNGASAGDYNVQYRKRGTSGEWITAKSYQSPYFITGLEDLTEYEYRVGSVCGNLQNFYNDAYNTNAENAYAYSAIQYFTTDSKDKSNENFQCGIMPAIDISNKTIYQGALGVNDVIMAGDFPVTITQANGIGNYSGEGYIIVPYLGDTKLKVSFNNIQINTDKKLIAGTIETTYDPSEKAVVDTKEFKHTWNDLKYIFQEVVNIIDDVIEKGFFSQKEYETFDNYHIDNENNTKELIKNLSISNLITPELKAEIEATQKEIEKLKQEINCPIKTDDSKPKGSDSDYPYTVISDCNDTLSRYLEKVKYLNELKNQAQASAINKIINGEATPPQFTELGQGTPPKTVTASRLREIQASCEDGVLGYWKPKGFKKAFTENNEAYSYCLSQSDEVFYHYKGDNYWWVDGNWYIEGNTYQCGGKAFDCFLIYDYNTAKYIPAKIEIGTSIGEDTAQFITYLLVRDIPLMLIGSGGGTIYEVALNTLADPLISYLNATDKITDEQALAAGLTTILAGNVKHLTPENITKIKTVLTEKVKTIKQKTGKNAKDIAFELKDKIKTIANKEAIQRVPWNGAKNIFKATDEEIAEAAQRIKAHRAAQNAGIGGNYGYLEGKIGNISKKGEMVRSGAPDDNVKDLFETLYIDSKQVVHKDDINGAWLRTTDSEYKMLNRLANELGAEKGKVYKNIIGELKIVSERAYCPSCQGVIQQFNEMFPNVKLILIDNIK